MLVSAVPPSLERRIRTDTLVIQKCQKSTASSFLSFRELQLGKPMVVEMDCRGEPGMSGGIFFRKKGDTLLAVGLLVRGNPTPVEAIVLDKNFVDSIPRMTFFSVSPANADVFSSRGKFYLRLGKIGLAVIDFDEAIRLDSRHADAFEHRGVAYRRQGQIDRAIGDLSEAIRLRLDPKAASALNSRCWTRAVAGRELNEALADCNEALRLRPNDANTLNSRGLVHLKLGQLDKAIADYTAALEARPKYPSYLFGRGLAKRMKGEAEAADADIAAARAIDPTIAKEYARYGLE